MAYQMFQNGNLKDTAFQTINRFVPDLINEGKKIGMSVEKPKELVPRLYTQNSVESVMTYLRKKYPKLQLVMFISNENDQLYNEIKYMGDVKLGITTQCIHQKNVWKYNSSLMMNFLLKVNAKMGGINAKINEQIFGDKPEFLKSSTMIIAADVTVSLTY
jgi:eukaryotic translation initiation factor 2C